ncbi:uncharacterized protein [Dysidea avara]|uniref:uncharacterized protein n=1 Tax=Dysidea avara TaxID=196820 RepID=UPI00332938C7
MAISSPWPVQLLVCFTLLLASSAEAYKRYYSAEYLATHGSIAPNCGLLADKSLQCHLQSRFQRLLSIQLYPKGHVSDGGHVFAEVKLGIDTAFANENDSDFVVLLSDGQKAIGFIIADKSNYDYPYYHEPCFHLEGTPGETLTRRKSYSNGPKIHVNNTVPQEFDFYFSTKQKWGGCVTATAYEGSYTTSGHYTSELQANNGLYLDIYSEDDLGEMYTFKYITVDIQIDS